MKKTFKTIIITSFVLAVIFSSIAVFLYLQIDIKETETVRIPLSEGKEVLIEIEPHPELGPYERYMEEAQVIRMHNNQKGVGSVGEFLTYFDDKNSMTDYYFAMASDTGESVKYPLEKGLTPDGNELEYILKFIGSGIYGGGVAYLWSPSVEVHGYKASRILSYTNFSMPEDKEYEGFEYTTESSQLIHSCVFSLNQFAENESGYLVFGGYASVGTETDYCEELIEMEEFSMEIR